jgi:hypothetical protein
MILRKEWQRRKNTQQAREKLCSQISSFSSVCLSYRIVVLTAVRSRTTSSGAPGHWARNNKPAKPRRRLERMVRLVHGEDGNAFGHRLSTDVTPFQGLGLCGAGDPGLRSVTRFPWAIIFCPFRALDLARYARYQTNDKLRRAGPLGQEQHTGETPASTGALGWPSWFAGCQCSCGKPAREMRKCQKQNERRKGARATTQANPLISIEKSPHY